MNQKLVSAYVALAAVMSLGNAYAQTMPDKWDQKCLDDAGKNYISCMASATTEPAKQQCQNTMNEEKKRCKKN